VLVVQPSLQPPGGGNSIAAWTIEALKRDHDMAVCTLVPPDFGAINRFYGTAIRPAEVTAIVRAEAAARLIARVPLSLALLSIAIHARAVRRVAHEYDLVISGNNEADLGRPGIQYIHYPITLRPRPPADLRWYHLAPLLAVYYRLCDAIAVTSIDRVRRNLTLVNSDWTGARVTRLYGISTETLYPPVTGDFPPVPWATRENGVVCVGRISPEKNLDRVIDIMLAVRRRAPDIRLHLIGTPGPRGYTRRIRRRALQHRTWITLHEDLPRADLIHLVARQRYGIHGMRDEHFGIAPAEMLRAGCIVWVPRGGGQVEIVGGDERFLYDGIDDAVARIVQTLEDPRRQEQQRADLAARRAAFSAERFMTGMRAAVARMLSGSRG
jgi:glycosyltransferase involved in cell wall biosynthesis